MPLWTTIAFAVAAAAGLYSSVSNRYFVDDACDRLDTVLSELLVGQPIATSSIARKVCAHIKDADSYKPLVLSVHGPPGTGKTFTHWLTAQAVYGLIGGKDKLSTSALKKIRDWKHASEKQLPQIKAVSALFRIPFGNPLSCPGPACPSYKIIYSVDYTTLERHDQASLVKEAILNHAYWYPESVIVIEEYDKMHCETRNMLRQLLHNPSNTKVSLNKVVLFLEANRGMFPIQELLTKNGGKRELVKSNAAHLRLKSDMFDHWSSQTCDVAIDVAKFVNGIDMFIPFFPLERQHIKELVLLRLKLMEDAIEGDIKWSMEVIDYFMTQVTFEGIYAIDGAVEAGLPLKTLLDSLKEAENGPCVNAECPSPDRIEYQLGIKNNQIVIRNWCNIET